MNARLTTPTFAVVSSEPKQTARAEVALRAGPAEPERRLDVVDNDKTVESEPEQSEEDESPKMSEEERGEFIRSEMLRREALGVGSGDDKTPPLSELELREVTQLVANIRQILSWVEENAVFATDWRRAQMLPGRHLPPGDQLTDPQAAREALEQLRLANAALSGSKSSAENAKAWLVYRLFLHAEGKPHSDGRYASDDEIAHMVAWEPQFVAIQHNAQIRQLYEDTIVEIIGEKTLRKRDPEAEHKARWIETSHLLAMKLNIEVGGIDAWSKWLNGKGYVVRRQQIVYMTRSLRGLRRELAKRAKQRAKAAKKK